MNKKKVLLPFFVLKLFLINFVFFSSILISPIYKQKMLIISSLLILLYLFIFGKDILSKTKQPTTPIKLINVKNQQNKIITFKNSSKLKLFKNKLIGLNKLSPGNRDVLINLSLISFYQNEVEEHNKLWRQAQDTDPNNPLFEAE